MTTRTKLIDVGHPSSIEFNHRIPGSEYRTLQTGIFDHYNLEFTLTIILN